MSPVIELKSITTKFGEQYVHRDISFNVDPGNIVAVIGGSGSGKSTLLKEIVGLLHPTGKLSLQQVREAVLNVARYDLDGLREALLVGDVARLARTLDGLRQEGEAATLVLWAMTEEIRALAQVHAGLREKQPLDLLLREARIWGPRQTLFRRALQRHGEAAVKAALTEAARIDRLIKGIGSGDLWNEFLRLGLVLR